ncbi:MAG: hypothetical protein ACLU0O_06675 [Collinsella sp.]
MSAPTTTWPKLITRPSTSKVNSEIMNALNAIVRFASIIMIPLGLALFASSEA